MKRPIITLLTDFGLTDYYVAAMKGVILGICPDAQIVDITHEIEPYGVTHAAYLLRSVWRSFPEGTIHVAVVDPGVGSVRHPILASESGHFFIGPDNGIFSRVAEAPEVRLLSNPAFQRQPVSATFHGRDIFAPAAAHLAAGIDPTRFGPPLSSFFRLPESGPTPISTSAWVGEVLWIDHFGNAVTSFDTSSFGWVADQPFALEANGQTAHRYARFYGEIPESEPCLIAGSAGMLEISMNKASVAREWKLAAGAKLQLSLRS